MSLTFSVVPTQIRTALLACAGVALISFDGVPAAPHPVDEVASVLPQESPAPIPTDLQERSDVRLVLVDVHLNDRNGNTVPGLGLDDFGLWVDGRRQEIDTVDNFCPDGVMPAPRFKKNEIEFKPPARLLKQARIVFLVDYFHIALQESALRELSRGLDALVDDGVEMLVVSLAEGLRIEQDWTTERSLVREAFARMRGDADLYNGFYEHETEFRVFRRLEQLLDLMEMVPGRKVVALLSGPFDRRRGFNYDPQFKRLAAIAASSRTSFYPLNSLGLDEVLFPPTLARLAVDTGGRMTSGTNGFGRLGLARAQRDLACSYTLGFYDRGGREDRERRLRVEVKRPSTRVHHARHYILRTAEERQRSMFYSSSFAPSFFDPGPLELSVDLRPGNARRRTAWIRADLPASAGLESGRIRMILRNKRGTVLRSARARFGAATPEPPPRPLGDAQRDEESEPRETRKGWHKTSAGGWKWERRVKLRPGRYQVIVSVAVPGRSEPWVTQRVLKIPDSVEDGSGTR